MSDSRKIQGAIRSRMGRTGESFAVAMEAMSNGEPEPEVKRAISSSATLRSGAWEYTIRSYPWSPDFLPSDEMESVYVSHLHGVSEPSTIVVLYRRKAAA